jgi:hypothetical protein
LLWLKAQAVGVRPSNLLGLKENTYEAYCLDEAVIYFGMTLQNRLEQAGHKPSKEERKAEAARKRILDQVLSEEDEKKGSGFADPAAMFG